MAKKIGLTREQIKDLRELISGKGSSVGESQRAQAILMLEKKIDLETISELTDFQRSTIFSLKKKFLKNGISSLKDKRKKKVHELLTRSQKARIVELLTKHSPKEFGYETDFWMTSILAQIIEEQFGVRYKSKTSLYLIFKQASFSYHKPGQVYRNRDQKIVDQWLQENSEIIQNAMNDDKIVVLAGDEMILSTRTTFQKIWVQKGHYPKIDVSSKRQKRSIYGFLNLKSGREHAFKTQAQTMQETCNILDKIRELYPSKKIMILWDNSPWHKGSMVKNYLEKAENKFHLLAFPPYAPELNPQEHVWKAGRSKVSHNRFIENIDSATDELIAYFNEEIFKYKIL